MGQQVQPQASTLRQLYTDAVKMNAMSEIPMTHLDHDVQCSLHQKRVLLIWILPALHMDFSY